MLNTVQPSLFVGIGGSNLSLLVDSGSSVTISDVDVYNKLQGRQKPELRSSNLKLTTASGSSLIVFGKADFVFKLGSRSFTQKTVVATLQGL